MASHNLAVSPGPSNKVPLLAQLRVLNGGGLEARRARETEYARIEAEMFAEMREAELDAEDARLEAERRDAGRRARVGESAADILADAPDSDENAWIWRGLVARGAPQLLIGAPKVGKSWAMLEMAVAAATGRPYLGLPNALGRRARVLVLSLEDGRDEVGRRLRELCRAHGIDRSQLATLQIEAEKHLYLDDPEERRLRNAMKEFRPDLVIIDSLSRAHHGGDSGMDSVKPALDEIQELSRTYNAAVVVLHHEARASKAALWERARGAGDIAASARWLVSLRQVGKKPGRVAVETGGNVGGGRAAHSMLIELVHRDGATRYERIDSDGDAARDDATLERAIVDYVRAHPDANKTDVVQGGGLGRGTTVREAWERLVDRGELVAHGRGKRAVWRAAEGGGS